MYQNETGEQPPKHRLLLKRRAASNEQGPELTRIQQISASANDIPKKVDAETRLAGVITGTVRQIFQAATKVKTHSFRFESLPAEGRQGVPGMGTGLEVK